MKCNCVACEYCKNKKCERENIEIDDIGRCSYEWYENLRFSKFLNSNSIDNIPFLPIDIDEKTNKILVPQDLD